MDSAWTEEQLELITHIINRIPDGWGKTIDCGPGWANIVIDCHNELLAIDPEYTPYQIKQKFGSLRFYFGTLQAGDKQQKMWDIVKKYELRSMETCELTGDPGVLMQKNRTFRTLAPGFTQDGWVVVPNQ